MVWRGITCIGLVLSLLACGGGGSSTSPGNSSSSISSTASSTASSAASSVSSNASSLSRASSTTVSLPACSAPVLDSAKSVLSFDSSGAPTSLMLHNIERLSSNTSNGFFLINSSDSSEVRLLKVSTSGNTITVSEAGGLPRFTFRIDTYPRHLSLHLRKVEPKTNLDEMRNYTLQLRLRANASLSTFALDNLVTGSGGSKPSLTWSMPWAHDNLGSYGAVTLYDASLGDADSDAALTSVWVNENLPKPAGASCWYEPQIKAWLSAYQAKFSGLNEVMLEASSPEELYALSDQVAIANNIKRVYLHTRTWKAGSEYHPNKYSWVDVNTDVFPNGRSDLVKYATYLREHGIMLHLHLLSAGVPMNDATYATGKIDSRIASWGSGTLEKAISATDTEILFRPAAGVIDPALTLALYKMSGYYNYLYLRIGDEVIKLNSITQLDQDVWVLSVAKRAYAANPAQAYAAGSAVTGIFMVWDKDFVLPYDLDLPNSLMEEYAATYGNFISEVGLDHIHFDGPSALGVYPGSVRAFQSRVYSYVNRPATSSSVGQSIDANLEQRFSALKYDKVFEYFPISVGVRPDGYGTFPATSWLDTQFAIQESIMTGGRRVEFTVPYSGRGINQAVLATHGLADQVIGLFKDWQKLAPKFDDTDLAYVSARMTRPSGSNHYAGEDVLVLSKNSAGEYLFTPRHVMGKTDGSTALWQIQQEKGTLKRYQAVNSGETINLNNPKSAQNLSFSIRVAATATAALTNPSIQLGSGGSLSITGSIAPGEYVHYEAGNSTAGRYDRHWKLIENLAVKASNFKAAAGSNSITVNDSTSATIALETQYIVNDSSYRLSTNDKL